jgi:hypothetical protein
VRAISISPGLSAWAAAASGGERGNWPKVVVKRGALTMHRHTLRDAIEWAYGVRSYQIAGPACIDDERYEIGAKSAAPVATGGKGWSKMPGPGLRVALRASPEAQLAEFLSTLIFVACPVPDPSCITGTFDFHYRPARSRGLRRCGPPPRRASGSQWRSS